MDLNLNAKDLQKQNNDQEKKRTMLYEDILRKANIKIKRAHDLKKTETEFEIPQIVFGQPKVDTEACIIFLMYKLRENKFKVKQISETKIRISWKPKKKNKEKKIKGIIKEQKKKKSKNSKKDPEVPLASNYAEPLAFRGLGSKSSSFDHIAARAELIRKFESGV